MSNSTAEIILGALALGVTMILGVVSWNYLRLSHRLQRIQIRPVLWIRFSGGVFIAKNVGRGPAVRLRADYLAVGETTVSQLNFEVTARNGRAYAADTFLTGLDIDEEARVEIPEKKEARVLVFSYLDIVGDLYVLSARPQKSDQGPVQLACSEESYPSGRWL